MVITECYCKEKLEHYYYKRINGWEELEITNHLCKCDRCLDIVIDIHKKKKEKENVRI